jgi:7-carboxy-7-deazaguanine synthase
MSNPHGPLPIHERFYTFQGEGVYMGMPAFFIRTFGCPVHCPWCDSAGTWHKDYVPEQIQRMDPFTLAQEAHDSGAKIAVITGGEPAIHPLGVLIGALHAFQIRVHLETSGGFQLNGQPDWVTLSPKRWARLEPRTVELANEFKLIVEGPGDIDWYVDALQHAGHKRWTEIPIWLHPEWSKHKDPQVLTAITNAVKNGYSCGIFFRAGWQLHKLYAADALDLRSKPLVPLGGNPALGF